MEQFFRIVIIALVVGCILDVVFRFRTFINIAIAHRLEAARTIYLANKRTEYELKVLTGGESERA